MNIEVNRPSFKKNNLGLRAFVSLMIVSALGVLLKFPITFPNRLFFNRVIEYTSTNYSYKPGQSGTTYNFFILNNDNLFVELPLLLVMCIAFLFYFGILTAISIFIGLKNNSPYVKRDILFTILFIGIFSSPKFLPIEEYLGINKKGAYWIKNRFYSDTSDVIWEVGIQKIRGAIIDKNHAARRTDSSLAVLKKIENQKTTTIFSDKLKISGTNLFSFAGRDTIWILENKSNYLKGFSMTKAQEVIQNKDDIIKLSPNSFSTGIANLKYSTTYPNFLTIITNDGQKLFLNTDNNKITTKRRTTESYYLSNINQHRKELVKRHGNLSSSWKNKRIFLDAVFVGYNDEILVIRHKKDIKKETKHIVSGYNLNTAELLWEIKEADYSFLHTIHGSTNIKFYDVSNGIKLNFYDAFTLKGSVFLNKQGEVTQVLEASSTIF